MYKWMLPGATAFMILSLVLEGLLWWKWSLGASVRDATLWGDFTQDRAFMLMWFLGGTALVSFLLSRYVVGLAKYSEWQMMRAGASEAGKQAKH